MSEYVNQNYDAERALYGIRDSRVRGCTFAGPADGESAIKECRNIEIEDCRFELRYPMWHLEKGMISRSTMTETCRAALWYDKDLRISASQLHGIKALRECDHSELIDCDMVSAEFGWFCRGIRINNSRLEGEYPFLKSSDLILDKFELKGKYSFQYVQNARISNSVLNTKDAFWHCHDVTVTDSVVAGEYLGWYSENLTLIRCEITGTQPLCYARNLRLVDCTMKGCDLAFERSSVNATILGRIESIKAPLEGSQIKADEVGVWLDEDETPISPVEA